MSDKIEAEILDVLGEEVVAAVDTPLVVIEGPKGDPGAAGKDGHSPVVTATKSGKTTTISVDGAAIATVEDGADGAPGKDGADGSNGKDGKDGAPGAKGADGITPTIGANGHWYLGPTDTGKPSRGEKGEKGDPGLGADWSQNDPDGDGYIKNRPGGYMTDPVITDADAFTITSAEDGGGVYMAMVAVESSAITLSDYVIGDGVVVDFGGQSYSLTWQSMEGFPACGAAVTGEATDWSAAPFCIIAAFEKDRLQGYYVYLQNAVTSSIQVQIKKAKQTPVKIPTKYLESDVYIVKVTSKSNEQRPGVEESDISYDVTVSATYDDIVAAVNAGKMPILLGEPVLSDPVLRLVDIDTDTVDGATPKLTFGGAYFRQSDRLYGTRVVIYSTGEATCCRYDSSFVNRNKGVDDAMSDTSFNPVQNRVIKKYVDDHVAGGLPLGLKSAAVGQIAKIKAVDASGVPTAWAPVSMPSGVPGKSAYELAVQQGFDGDLAAWLASIKGDTGATGPQGAPGKDGPKGDPGTPGKDGANGKDGADGKPGAAGADGVTPHIGGNGNWYIGSTDTGKPSRGATGAKGDAGATGPAGPAGPAGAPGKDGANGETGPQGPKGDPGTPGASGHTPVKGADYWTAADKQEIVNDVLAALPDGTEVSY